MLSIFLSGCASSFLPTKTEDKELKKLGEIQKLNDSLNDNNKEKLSQVGILATGTGYALNKVKEPIKEVNVAKELNEKVISLAGTPTIEDINKIQQIVDDLVSDVKKERERGAKSLADKDDELTKLQNDFYSIENQLKKKNDEFDKLSLNIAKTNDKSQATLDQMNSWFGLGAVFYGVKRFLVSGIIGICIFVVIFLLLRVFAASNPIVGGIFSIFESIGGMVIGFIKHLIPNSVGKSNLVNGDVHGDYRNTLLKALDVVHEIQHDQLVAGANAKPITIKDVIGAITSKLTDAEVVVWNECLKELNWSI